MKVIGGTSYNELLSRLIALLGDDAPAAAAAASAAAGAAPAGAAAGMASPPKAPAAAAPAPAPSQPSQVHVHVLSQRRAVCMLTRRACGPHTCELMLIPGALCPDAVHHWRCRSAARGQRRLLQSTPAGALLQLSSFVGLFRRDSAVHTGDGPCVAFSLVPASHLAACPQAALALSIKERSGADSGGAAEDGARASSAVVTPNSAAAAAFDRALHSRGGSMHIMGAVPGLSEPHAQQW